jgi:uncharacterized protein with HEPN domain
MRSDSLLLQDILQATIDIQEFITGISQEEFIRSKLIRAAVVQKLIVIGEAASRLSDEKRRGHPNVPWREIRDFRNIAVHNYASIDDFYYMANSHCGLPGASASDRANPQLSFPADAAPAIGGHQSPGVRFDLTGILFYHPPSPASAACQRYQDAMVR